MTSAPLVDIEKLQTTQHNICRLIKKYINKNTIETFIILLHN